MPTNYTSLQLISTTNQSHESSPKALPLLHVEEECLQRGNTLPQSFYELRFRPFAALPSDWSPTSCTYTHVSLLRKVSIRNTVHWNRQTIVVALYSPLKRALCNPFLSITIGIHSSVSTVRQLEELVLALIVGTGIANTRDGKLCILNTIVFGSTLSQGTSVGA
jgi:hypothetical protein